MMSSSTLVAPASIGNHPLPTGWKVTTVGELFEIQQGKALSPAGSNATDQYPFLRTSNVFWGRVNLSVVDSMGLSAAERIRLRLEPGDLLVCEGGDIGRSAVWNGEIVDCYFQNHIHRLRPRDDRANPRFYVFWLQLAFTRLGVYEGAGTKTTIANLSQGRLSALEVPLPPIGEQQDIVRTLSSIQKASTLTAAVADASSVLRDTLRNTLLQRPDWPLIDLGEVAVIRSGGTPSRTEPAFWGGDIPWVKTGEIDYGVVRHASEHITRLGLENSSARMIPSGTILMAMYGDGVTRGRVAMLGLDAAINQACAAIVPDHRLDRDFLYQYLASAYQDIRALGHGAHQKNLSATLLKKIPVPVPTPAEQASVAAALSTIDVKVRAERLVVEALQVLFNSMLCSLLTSAEVPA